MGEFPDGSAGYGSGTVTAMAQVAAVARVQIPGPGTSACHRCGQKKKKKKKKWALVHDFASYAPTCRLGRN